jgi:hypothetical protein
MGDEEREASAKTEDRAKSPAGEPEAGLETLTGARAGTSARLAEEKRERENSSRKNSPPGRSNHS